MGIEDFFFLILNFSPSYSWKLIVLISMFSISFGHNVGLLMLATRAGVVCPFVALEVEVCVYLVILFELIKLLTPFNLIYFL